MSDHDVNIWISLPDNLEPILARTYNIEVRFWMQYFSLYPASDWSGHPQDGPVNLVEQDIYSPGVEKHYLNWNFFQQDEIKFIITGG